MGFALFSMFFGAGNVIFPPFLGMEAGSRWLEGFSAYFIADIGLAMMGMFALLRVGSSEAGAAARGQAPCRDPYVRHRAVHRPHGGHPPHQRQHLRNGHRPQPERRVAGGVLRGIFCADPCAVPEGVRRGGHRGQGAHAAAAGGTVRHHHQGHRDPAGRDRRPAADQQRDRHRHQGGLPDHGCAGGAALRHHYFAERHRQGL